MTRHTYLLKSRHGIYYFRMVLPPHVRQSLGIKARELRVSLRTTDRERAKFAVAQKVFLMSRYLTSQPPWESQGEEQRELYELGIKLIRKFGEIDLDNEFSRQALFEELSLHESRAYVFAKQYQEELKSAQKKAESHASSETSHTTIKPQPMVDDPAAEFPPTVDATLSAALGRFLEDKKEEIGAGTLRKYSSQCKLFIRITTNDDYALTTSQLGIEHVRRYTDALRKLPARVQPDAQSPIEDLLNLPGKKISPKTTFSHAQAVQMYLQWCRDQQYPVKGNLESILKPLLKKPKQDERPRRPYNNEELKKCLKTNCIAVRSLSAPVIIGSR